MKVTINTINFYNNVVIINHVHDNKTFANNDNLTINKMDEDDLSDITPHIVVNDNENHPLIAELEGRILQSENEKKELLEQLNEKKATKNLRG
ncbi:MAG: hypothetical protein ABIN91_19470 [Mucilaginibacter sp.]|jgi:hypothetical protein|uniref:hypothetical protein n=1 Tax=Mucilaginibacter sp. TaxID=1882438 RepID=UPI003266DAFE